MGQNTFSSWLRWDWRSWAGRTSCVQEAEREPLPSFVDERRNADRFPCGLGITCRPIAMAPIDPWPAVLLDVSATGVALVLDQPLPIGSFLALQLPVRGKLQKLRVRVVSVRAQDDGGWVLGCTLERRLRNTQLRALT